jgi:hypothetical protein
MTVISEASLGFVAVSVQFSKTVRTETTKTLEAETQMSHDVTL